jgi:choice-of-anchor C domain-containing protein
VNDYLKAAREKAQNLLVNGSFEEGPELQDDGLITLDKGSSALKGWEVTQGDVDCADGRYWQPAAGKRSLDLSGTRTGGISQSFKTRKGQKYRVTFWLAGNPVGGAAEKKLQISAAGKSAEFAFDTNGKNQKEMGWVSKSWEFTAEADQTTLEFLSLTEGNYGPALDNVTVVEVNE